ncbi:hypothetical protein KC19_11G140500 [Ceratodon purpureus]|uniref:Oberon PHD finger domain-containing protein n=1 Tax=Ceratodon purpureus TaxID=3225 RepID=A0A8T0GKF3_CERPU|nr:hypothetical protein KC19_11G140500 [Ceratodon purpureus]
MAQRGDAPTDLAPLDRRNNYPEAAAALHPDGHDPDASLPAVVLLDGSGVVDYYGYTHEGDENLSLEQLMAGPEKEVFKEQALHSRDNDGLAGNNVKYAENQIPESVPKTPRVADIFVEDQAPRQQVPHNPSIGLPEPPRLPESFRRHPVPPGGKGEGWPYAPQGWPKPDDKWGWRVGQRAAPTSLWIDRYVTLPVSLMKGKKINISDEQFASKKSLVEYLKQTFPGMMDPNSIFKAFDWKVPALKNVEGPEKRGSAVKRDKTSPMDVNDSWQKSKKQCRAGNPHCPITKGKLNESESLERLYCNICCIEPNFCRECMCILCCKLFARDVDDFCIIQCRNTPLAGPNSLPSERGICGHTAHLDCALKNQLAGVIKKYRLNLEYMCRRCDRKTNLKETLSRLVSEFMNAEESKVDSSLQLLMRVMVDPGDEASSSRKIQEILLGALKKVQEGADIDATCKELTEQLLEAPQSGQCTYDNQVLHQVSNWSQARGRKRAFEDPQHSYEDRVDRRGPRSKSVGSPDAQGTLSPFMFQKNNKSTSADNILQGCPNDTSPAVHRIDSSIVSEEVCEGNGVTATSSTRAEPDLNLDRQLPRISLQNSLKPEDILSSIPTNLLSRTPSLSSLMDQSVSKPPTLSFEEHIRQCEAMTDRVKSAGSLGVFLNSDPKPPSLIASSLATENHGNQVDNPAVEAAADTRPPSAGEVVTSILSSSTAKSPSLFNSQDADIDHIKNTEIVEVRESSRLMPATRSSARRASLSSSQDAGGHHTARAKTIVVSDSSRKKPRPSSSEDKGPSLTTSQDAGGDDVVVTQMVEAPLNVEPLQMMPATRSSTRRASLSSSQDAGGHHTASAKTIIVSNSSRKKPRPSSSEDKGPSLTTSQDAGGDDVVVTQMVEVPLNVEPLQMIELPAIPSFDPALEPTDGAGFESELEDRISEALKNLKRAQAAEYDRAEESLNAQKVVVLEQYRLVDKGCRRFARNSKKDQRRKSTAEFDRAMNRVMAQYGKAQEERKAFESMLAISNGYSQISEEVLRDFFKWSPSDVKEA